MFLTGQAEIHSLCKKLRRTFPPSSAVRREGEGEGEGEGQDEGEGRISSGEGRRKRKWRRGGVGGREKGRARVHSPEFKVDLDE